MKYDKELMDIGILGEGFDLSHLFGLREHLLKIRVTLERLKSNAIYRCEIRKAVEFETKLHYLNSNIELVEHVMSVKELRIFEITEYAEICLN